MKLAVLGAPGAGKSEFAARLDIELSKRGYEPFVIVDDYIKDLRIDTDLEYGEFGTFIDDLQVVFKRRECELMYGRNGQSTITVGTVLDSTVHNFVRTEEAERSRRGVGLTTERLKTMATTFGLLYTESWDYDYTFLLRTDDLIGHALVDLLSTYRAPVLSFKSEVPDDKKASTAAAAIHTLEEKQSPQVDERGVRGSGETGEADGDSSESMPDVPEQGRASNDA